MADHPAAERSRDNLARLRSMLFVPGHREDWLEAATRSGSDAVVADLEDSVPEAQLEAARAAVVRFLATRPPVTCVVRCHGSREPAFADDVAAAVSPATAALVVPKVSEPADVLRADAAVGRHEEAAGLPTGCTSLILLIESARAVVRMLDLVDASPRVAGTMFAGAEGGDLVRDLGAVWTTDPRSLLYARSRVLLESRAAGLPLIMDSVFARIGDDATLREDTLFGRSLGFTGRPAVHPSQVPVINQVYTPTETEVGRMRELLASYEAAAADGMGAVLFQGMMIDAAMANSARAMLARRGGHADEGQAGGSA